MKTTKTSTRRLRSCRWAAAGEPERWTDVRGVASATEDLQLAELHHVTGETIVPGDIVQYHGDRGEVECVVSGLTGDPQNDWHFRTNGPTAHAPDGARRIVKRRW